MVYSVTLTRFAIWGGVVSIGGAIYMSYKIHRDFTSEQHYKNSLVVFNGYELGARLLGPPIQIKKIDLGDTSKTWSDGYNARLAIPLQGSKKKATLHSWSHRLKPVDEWTVDKCDMEMDKKQWTFYIHPDSKDKFKPTEGHDTGQFPQNWLTLEETRAALLKSIQNTEIKEVNEKDT